jgi:hypothetical protein
MNKGKKKGRGSLEDTPALYLGSRYLPWRTNLARLPEALRRA